MTRRLMFWVLMLVWLVWGVSWHFALVGAFGPVGFGVLLFLLFGLVGWQVFGPPISG
jgi:hypothetical protein